MVKVSDKNGIVELVFINYYPDTLGLRNHHIVFVKSEFLNRCPNYLNLNTSELFEDGEIFKYLHNPNGPAVIDVKHGHKNWFIDGDWQNKEKVRRLTR